MTGTAQRILAEAESLGRDAGNAAGGWVADGNTSAAALRRMAEMFDEGEAFDLLDGFSGPLSGEWSGDPTPASLAADLGIRDDSRILDAACQTYEDAWYQGWHEEAERTVRAMLPDPEDGPDFDDPDYGAVRVETIAMLFLLAGFLYLGAHVYGWLAGTLGAAAAGIGG